MDGHFFALATLEVDTLESAQLLQRSFPLVFGQTRIYLSYLIALTLTSILSS